MINVKDSPYNAYGDDLHDDTAALQAALTAAAVKHEKVVIPLGRYLTSDELVPTVGLTLEGEGNCSAIVAAPGFPANKDIIRWAPTMTITGMAVRDLAIVPNGRGRHGINIDPGEGVSILNASFERLLILPTSTGNSIKTKWMAYSEIKGRCNLESVWLEETGDGVLLADNVLTGGPNSRSGLTSVVRFSQVPGSGNFRAIGNVLAGTTFHMWIESALKPHFVSNESETPYLLSNTQGALWLLGGEFTEVKKPFLLDNEFHVLPGSNSPYPIMMVNTTDAYINGGYSAVLSSSDKHIFLAANAKRTRIGAAGQYTVNGITQLHPNVQDSSVGGTTLYERLYSTP